MSGRQVIYLRNKEKIKFKEFHISETREILYFFRKISPCYEFLIKKGRIISIILNLIRKCHIFKNPRTK